MKAVCQVCGIEGYDMGNNRIQHYAGFKDGKRKYSYHKVENSLLISRSKVRVLSAAPISYFYALSQVSKAYTQKRDSKTDLWDTIHTVRYNKM